ncbi:hypothetical protein KJ865_05200 [Myxococcota bacterium]|nr:hypothetical protein [Myxococcota bacterium]
MAHVDKPKFLVDFDGVWTELSGQARAVDEAREQGLARITEWPLREIRLVMAQVQAELDLHPAAHGWRDHGRITAFSDEDPFLTHNSLCAAIQILAEEGHPRCLHLYEALRKGGYENTNELGSELFHEGSAAYLKASGHALLPEAVDSLSALLRVADVVFCSNFSTDAIAATWRRYGFSAGQTPWGGRLTLRGNAQKHVLTGDPGTCEAYNGRSTAVDRGHYLAILEEERPDVVVGDVFSLDLALPLVLKRSKPHFKNMVCLLKITRYTPPWSLELCRGGAGDGLFSIHSPSELATCATTLPKEGGR